MKKFGLAKYVVPSIIAMVLVGTYTNIDGLFIGNRAGDDGLAAINAAWPIVAFITSLGTALGMGASVEINDFRGQNKLRLAEKIKNTALLVLLIAGVAATAFCLAIYSPLLKLLGARDAVLTYAENYALVISLGAVFQVIGAGIVVLLRNDGKTFLSAAYTAIGLAVHVALDFVLVNKYALYGVAVSTVISQATVAALGLFSFLRKKKGAAEDPGEEAGTDDKAEYKKFPYAKNVIKSSFAPLGLNFAPSAALTFTNIFALKAGGVAAVSAYAVMSYVLYTYDYVFQGVCDGVQPLLSYYEGANDRLSSAKTVRSSCVLLAVFSAVFVALTPCRHRFFTARFRRLRRSRSHDENRLYHLRVRLPDKSRRQILVRLFLFHGENRLREFNRLRRPACLYPAVSAPLPRNRYQRRVGGSHPLASGNLFAFRRLAFRE